jgi:hypothetical protein
MLDNFWLLWYNNYRKKEVNTMFRRLDWMTNEQYEEVRIYWGLVCDYDEFWKDEQDFENWCKRVLKIN